MEKQQPLGDLEAASRWIKSYSKDVRAEREKEHAFLTVFSAVVISSGLTCLRFLVFVFSGGLQPNVFILETELQAT